MCVLQLELKYYSFLLFLPLSVPWKLVNDQGWYKHMWLYLFTRETWLIYTRIIQMCARLIDICDMTHSHLWHDSLTCVTWLTHMCNTTHLFELYDSTIHVTYLIHRCAMTPSYVRHHSLMRGWQRKASSFSLIDNLMSFEYVSWPIHKCCRTHEHIWNDSIVPYSVTSWQWCRASTFTSVCVGMYISGRALYLCVSV